MGLSDGNGQSFLEGKLVVITQSNKSGSPFHNARGPANAGIFLLFRLQFWKVVRVHRKHMHI